MFVVFLWYKVVQCDCFSQLMKTCFFNLDPNIKILTCICFNKTELIQETFKSRSSEEVLQMWFEIWMPLFSVVFLQDDEIQQHSQQVEKVKNRSVSSVGSFTSNSVCVIYFVWIFFTDSFSPFSFSCWCGREDPGSRRSCVGCRWRLTWRREVVQLRDCSQLQ